MQKGKIFGALSFGALQRRFVEEIRAASNALEERCWVLVPTNLLALHLKRLLASADVGCVGIKFLTLKDAAEELAGACGPRAGGRPTPEAARELVLARILSKLPPDSYFAGFRDFPGAPHAVAGAIQRLANSLWTPGKLTRAARRLRSSDADSGRRLREIAAMWASYEEWKEREGFFDADDVIAAAASVQFSRADAPRKVFIYGFYDLTPLQQSLVASVVNSSQTVRAFLLWAGANAAGPAPGFEYAGPTVKWVQETLQVEGVDCLGDDAPPGDLRTLRERLFGGVPILDKEEARSHLQEREAQWDGSVRVLSCPGEYAEALEVLRESFRQFSGRAGLNSNGVGVLMRTAQAAAHLDETFARAGVGHYLREGLPLAHTRAGKVLLGLLDMAVEGDARRDDVVRFLAAADIKWPEGLNASALDRASRRAGVRKGKEDWGDKLKSHARALERMARGAGAEHHGAEARLCLDAAGFVTEFFHDIEKLASLRTWHGLARSLERLLARYVPADDVGDGGVRELVRSLCALEGIAGPPRPHTVRRVLSQRLHHTSLKVGSYQRGDVTLSTLMACRGAAFDVVLVPGLCERGFPSVVGQDPILTEQDKHALNALADTMGAGQLSLRQRRPQEERYLLRMALASAGSTVVLCYPRLEQNTGRPKIVSRFVTAACEALVGFQTQNEDEFFENELPRHFFARIPLNRMGPEAGDLDAALDLREYDLVSFAGNGTGKPLTEYTARISPSFRRALALERQRWGKSEFGPYDGRLQREELLEYLRQNTFPARTRISPSRLEMYAKCPFRYFAHYLLEVEEPDKPTESFQLTPAERGLLVHELLCTLYREKLRDRALGNLTEGETQEVLADASDLVDEMGREYALSMPATWTDEKEKALEMLRTALLTDMRQHADACPHLFEFAFGGDRETDAPPLRLDEGAEVDFRGRMDRVDLLPDGFSVIDYKTGDSGRHRPDSFDGGRQLQLPVYLLAAAQRLNEQTGQAAYFFVSEPRLMSEFTLDALARRTGDLRTIVRLIRDGIQKGLFFPLPHMQELAYCENHCDFSLICGLARRTIAEMKASDPAARDLQELRSIS